MMIQFAVEELRADTWLRTLAMSPRTVATSVRIVAVFRADRGCFRAQVSPQFRLHSIKVRLGGQVVRQGLGEGLDHTGSLQGSPGLPGGSAWFEQARDTWADEFVAASLAKSLSVVAATDHHDVAMSPYIRDATVRIPMKPPGYTDLKPPGVPISKRPPFQSQIARDGVVS